MQYWFATDHLQALRLYKLDPGAPTVVRVATDRFGFEDLVVH